MKPEKGVRVLSWSCGGFSAAVMLSVLFLPVERLPLCAAGALIPGLLCLIGKSSRARKAALLLLFAVPGFLLTALRFRLTLGRAEELSGQSLTVTARVLDFPVDYGNMKRYTVRLTSPEVPRVKCQVNDYGNSAPSLKPGDEIECTLKLASALYRYGEETDALTSRGVFLRGTVSGELSKTGRWRLAVLFEPLSLREKIIARCAKLFPEDTAAFQTALLTGEKGMLYRDYPLYYALSRAGLMHVAAVSGMHVSFLVSFLGLMLPNKRRFGFLMLPLLAAFAALSGFTPSVCRAVFMQCVALMAPILRRENDSPTALTLVLAILLAVNPFAAASVSLQLSFAATAGILLFSSPIHQWLTERLPGGKWKVISLFTASALASSLSALVFSLPLTALHFGVVSLVSPLSNALCLWCVSLLFVGGYLAVGLFGLFPVLSRLLGRLLSWGDRYIFTVSRLLTKLPCAAVYTVNPIYAWWMAACYLLFAVCLLWARRRGEGVRFLSPVCLAALGLFFCMFSVRFDRDGIRVTALDVGQGSCTLIECGDDAVMVDCGGINSEDYVGESAAYYALGREHHRLSALVLTHPHRDHINGVSRLLALLDVETLYLPDIEGEGLDEVLSAAEKNGTRVVVVTEEMILWGEELCLNMTPPLERELNDESGLFVLASLGDWNVLITGDADQSQERRYVQLTDVPDIELLIMGHHGSANAGSAVLLDETKPETALISVGYNTYGHPSEETLERLEERHIEVHRTDLEGNITVKGGA